MKQEKYQLNWEPTPYYYHDQYIILWEIDTPPHIFVITNT